VKIEQLINADPQWQASGDPWSGEYGDVYFSREGGMKETQHVFLTANRLRERWQQQGRNAGVFTVAELGFGTGLNFLCCWQSWRQTTGHKPRLHYISCEKHPLTRADMEKAMARWPELSELATTLLAAYPDHTPGYHRLNLSLPSDDLSVTLDLYYGNAEDMLRAQANDSIRVDAWFLDGFTPARNPALWADSLLETIAKLSTPGTTISSYSVTSRVVRKLRSLDFHVERQAGFGHKRQMLYAVLSGPAPPRSPTVREVTVVGAGLAGCTVAWSLARRGYHVTVLERQDTVAAGASGNPQAILQCRLNRIPDALWQFNLLAFLYASRFYDWLQSNSPEDFDWHPCGVLTLETAYRHTRKAISPESYLHYPDRVLRHVTAHEASSLAGMQLTEGGLFLEHGGWLNPVKLCRTLLAHKNIHLRTNTEVAALSKRNDRWQLVDNNNRELTNTPCLVICNSYAARRFAFIADYPVNPLRGQISLLPASDTSSQLQTVVCSHSYLAPQSAGQHCMGASYVKHSEDTGLSLPEHEQVISGILPCLPELETDRHGATPGRASIRGSSGDFIPLAGPVPEPTAWRGIYGGAQHVTDKSPALKPALLPGLYMSVGHGSHGMASCPLLAEHIASLVSGEASPLQTAHTALVHPWRFIERKRKSAGLRPGE